MATRGSSFYFRLISLFFISVAMVLTAIELVQYSRLRSNYPPGMSVGGVPIGGLDPQATSQRLLQVYMSPVEIQYSDAVIHLDPTTVGFELDTESMLAAADLQRTSASFWGGFWNFLWNSMPSSYEIPLVASYSEDRLRLYLQNEISPRYDELPLPAQPIPGSTEFTPGIYGQTLDINRAIILIEDALLSPDNRVVLLTSQRTAPGRPPLKILKVQLQQIIDQNEFEGIVGFYLLDLQTMEELHFAYQNGEYLSISPDVAFTASSTVKISIMVSVFRHMDGRPDSRAATLILDMIKQSENPPADELMSLLNEITGPLIVTADMQDSLYLKNTFLAGFFKPGAPLLQSFQTPANQRIDVSTDPDLYNQTTPSDMGMLLEDIYQCAENGGGALIVAFPGQIDQTACQQMIEYLKEDKIGLLIQSGVPEGTQVAHKHGWVTDFATGNINHVSDAAIVYTPGGNFVLCIYVYHPEQVIWNQASRMYADLSRSVYNYFNLPSP